MWWDLESLVVDSVHWNGEAVTFSQLESQLHVDAPAPMQAGEQVVLEVWYGESLAATRIGAACTSPAI